MSGKTRLHGSLALAMGLILFGIFPLLGQRFLTVVLSLTFIYIASAEIWSFLAGHLGIVSLGQQAFIGLGMYTVLIICEIFRWPIWTALVLAGFVGAIVAAFVSLSFLRLRGFYFAFSTMLISEILFNIFLNWSFVGGASGKMVSVSREIPGIATYYLSGLVSLISILTIYFIHNSKLGFGVRAIGCDEDVAEEVGVNVFACKASCFIIGGFITALAGSLLVLHTTYVSPSVSFNFEWMMALVFIAIVGGRGTLIGPIIGSIIYIVLRSVILSAYVGLSLLLLGVACIVMLIVAPEGVWGIISKKSGLKPYI
jgi:branched-chain amino acid transport system permease protein